MTDKRLKEILKMVRDCTLADGDITEDELNRCRYEGLICAATVENTITWRLSEKGKNALWALCNGHTNIWGAVTSGQQIIDA